ncbi:hypothetical protein [Mesorhizobium comanense]|uniref:hypothetical protein n=1 Tax=Mesorhizobium comanense TaxID=2502215 RepID=UPI001E55116E|nr:hypothetical protein [Mesorhizobium comanense]
MTVRGERFHARAVVGRSRFAGQLLKTTALSTLALALSGAVAYGDDAGLWQPQIRAIVGADNNGGNAALEGFIPIKQTAESVLFLDVRAKHDFKDASGQDIGLGIRRIVNPDLMLGGYAYINLENYNSTQFTAGTLGVEAITPNFDAHVNVFVPIKGDSTGQSVSSTLSMVSNQLIEQISVLDHRDYAAWGIEGEVGARVPLNLPDKHSLRLDIGGYHFEDPHGDDGSVTGAKAGFEYTIGDVFGSGTELVLAGEVRDDNRDHTQFAGSVRLNIPFNPGHGSDTTGAISAADPVYPVSEGLRKRVNERVRGDIGVRVQSQDFDGGSFTRVAINAANNAAFGKFYYADGVGAGTGTLAAPTTLDSAVSQAGTSGFVVALGGNGNLTTAGVTLANGQTVIGGGESVTAKLFGGGTATFNLGGSDGTIQGVGSTNVITLANNNTLNGITITGDGNGILGAGKTGTLTKVTVDGVTGNGANFSGDTSNISASNFTSTNNGLDGLHIEDSGTYNFTGTTLLSGNHDDGLDITGHGTYTFATVNAQNNTDRGITVQGTSSGGTFTTTGGAISGNGGIGVYIDPITAHVVLDSISQTGGPAGVVLDQVSGSFTVNGTTTISNTTGPAIQITDSPAAIRFGGDVTIQAPNAGGIDVSGINGTIGFGNVYISGLTSGHTGLDLSGSRSTFTATLLNITGTGTSTGIDLSGATGGSVAIGSGTIAVGTGVQLGTNGASGTSANTSFTFGGGSITGTVASLDARGLNLTGTYGFGPTDLVGPQLFDTHNVIFVGSMQTGTGSGASLLDLASIATADANTASGAIFVLVNDGTAIDASGGFSLSAGQTLASFGNGRSFSLGGVPMNVTGDDVEHDQVVTDPGGGAATLTNSGAGAVVTAAGGGTLEDFNISGGSGAAISASGSGSLTIQGVTVSSVATGLSLNGFTGTGTFNNFDVTSAGTGVSITGGTTGTLTFDAASSIAGTTGVAFNIDSSTPNLTYNGTINQTAAASAVKINAMTGGSATFGGLVTASTGAANAIDLTANTGGKINFTGGLNIDTTSGAGFTATGGGTIGVAATAGDESIKTTTGQAINLTSVTIGSGGVAFDSITTGVVAGTGLAFNNVDGGTFSGGNVTVGGASVYGIFISGSPATFNFASATVANTQFEGIYLHNANGDVTFDTVDVTGTGRNGIWIDGATNDVTISAGSVETASVAINSSVAISNTATSTVDLGSLNIIGTNNFGLTVGSAAGTVKMAGGTITQTGSGGAVGIFDGTATLSVSIGADITSTGAPAQAILIEHTAGDITLSGDVTASTGASLFAIGTNSAPTGGHITLSGALTATGGGNAMVGSVGMGSSGLGVNAKLDVTGPLSITGATGNGLSVSNVAGSATFGAVTVSGASGNGIDIGGNAGSITFTGTTNVTMSSAGGTAGINFSGTNADVSFGTTNVTLGAGANQTGIDFSGSSTAASFGLTTIMGLGDITSRGIDLSSTTGNKTITFLAGSKIDDLGVGVELKSGDVGATSANANFTFGDGTAANGLQSSIIAAAGGYTVNTVGLDPALGNYNFNDVAFTGNAHLASAVNGTIMISQNGGVIAAGTDGLSAAVTTVTAAEADAMTGTLNFAFVGTVDLSGTPFTLDAGQSIIGFGNGTSILTSGTIQPVNVQGNLGATGGVVTGNEGVVKSTGSDTLHLLGGNQVKDTAFDFSGGSGSVFVIDSNPAGPAVYDNTGGIVINGVTVSNVAVGQTAFKLDGTTGTIGNVSITNNNINVAGTLLDANGGSGDITVTRGDLPNSGPAGTLTGGGISIANHTGGTVKFTDDVTIGGDGVSLTNNTGTTITFADLGVTTTGGNGVTLTNNTGSTITFDNLDVSTAGAAAFTATGGGAINVTTGTVANSNGQAVALDGITAGIHFTSTSATFSAGTGIDLQNVGGTADFGTGTLTNTGAGTSFNVGSATAASGGNADISYGGTIATNGSGAAVSIQGMTGGSVTLSGDLTDGLADSGGNIVIAGNDSAAITFSGSSKVINSGATDGVNIGFPGGFPAGTPSANTNSTIDFTNGGLDITTTTGTGFEAIGDVINHPPGTPSAITVTGTGNKINSGADGLLMLGANVGGAGITFDNISSVATASGGSVVLNTVDLAGDVDIGGLTNTGAVGVTVFGVTGTGAVNFTGTTDIDVAGYGFQFGGQIGTVNIANATGSSLTIDGGSTGISFNGVFGGTVNIGGHGGTASIGATTSTSDWAIDVNGNTGGTLNYNGSINVTQGSALAVSAADLATVNLSGTVTSTTSSTAFDFAGADGTYSISSTITHTGGTGVSVDGASDGTITFSGTSKTFSTGANDAIYKAPGLTFPVAQGSSTLNFTNGGLVITTTSGAGFTASTFGTGSVSVTKDGGADNTITTTTGTALKLDGATVGAGGVNFASISATGAATGISLNNVGGGPLSLGVVDLEDITGSGVQISGTLGSTLDATSIKIGLGAINAIGLNLNGASLGTSNIAAAGFDVNGGSFAGTLGIDMAGTTGTGTIQLGDTDNSPAGRPSTIKNVAQGVQFSSTTNANMVFGDGQAPAKSSISTMGGYVIAATDSLPTNGDYNFNDVNFSGDISNLSSISVYYVTADALGTGDGSLANPGTYANAQLSSANVIVLIDKTTGGVQQTIDMGSTSYQLHDGQVLLAFKSGDAAVDVSQLGVDASGGASAAFHFTTVQNSTVVSAPVGIDTLRPVLQSNTSGSVINLATSGTGLITGGVQNLIIRNLGVGGGITANASSASSFFLRSNDISVGGRALDFGTTGAPANTLLLSIDGNTLQSNGANYAASFSGQNVSATQNSIAIRSFSGNTVLNGAAGTGGGIAFSNVTFDSNGAGGTVSAGTLDIGKSGARVLGNGLSLTGTSGKLDLGTFTVFNDSGTGLLVDTKGPPATNFTLSSSGGSVDTTNGTALNLDPLTVNMTVGSVTSTGDTNGIIFDGVAGTFTVTGATSITGTSGYGIDANTANTGTFNFNTVAVDNTTTAGGGIHVATGTLNVSGLANIDTTSGNGILQAGGTTSFTGGLTVDTTTGTGIVGTGGTIGVTATSGAETVTSTLGQAISLSGVTADITLDSTSSGGGTNNVAFSNVSGSVALGGGTLSGATGSAFLVGGGGLGTGGTAAITYAGSITSGSYHAVDIEDRASGAGNITLSGNISHNVNADGIVVINNASGTITFSGTSKSISSGNSAGVNASNNTNATVAFTNGGLVITTNTGPAFYATGSGTVSVTKDGGADNTISTSGGGAVYMSGVIVGSSGVNFASTSNSTASASNNSSVVLTNVTGSGTINLGTGTLVGGSLAVINVTGGSANLTYSGNINEAIAGQAMVSVSGGHTGTITFNTGTLSATNGTGLQFNNANGAYHFNGTTTLNGGDAGVDILGGSTGTFSFGTGASITSPSGIAFNVVGGSASVTYAGTITQATASQRMIAITDTTGGAISFTTAVANGLNNSAATGTGILIDGAAGNVTVNNASLTGARGITILGDAANNATGTFTFNNVAIDTATGATNHAFVIDGDQGTPTNNDVSATINLNNVDITNPGGNVVNIQGMGGGSVNFDANSSINRNDGGLGIVVTSNAGGTINFGGSTKTLSTGTNNAVDLTNNGGATINFTNGGLAITTSSGTGFNATGGGTVTVQGTGNTITSTTGTALNVVNTTIGGSGLTFQSISSNGAANGIVLNNTGLAAGNGGLTVTGTGTTAGSGGTIQNAVQGALFTSTKNLSLSNMNFTNANSGNGTVNNIDGPTFNSAAQAAINMSSVSTASFTNLNLNGGVQVGINGQNVSNLTIANSTVTGFGDQVGEGNVKLWNLSGTSAVTNSTFGFVPGDTSAGENLFEVRNNSGTLTLNVTGSTFQNTRDSSNGSGGIAFTTTGTATATVNVSNSSFLNMKTSGFEGFAKQTSTLNVNITDGGTAGNGNTFDPTGTNQLSRAIGLNAQDTAQLTFNINRNKKIYGSGGPIINIYGQDSANIQGRINNNGDIQNNNTAANSIGGPISIHTSSTAATAVVEIIGNTIVNNGGSPSIEADVVGQGGASDHGTMDITIMNNTLTFAGRNLTQSNIFNDGIYLTSGASNTDATILTANVQGNTVNGLTGPSGNLAFVLGNFGGPSANIYLEGFNSNTTTTWNSRGNTPTGSVLDNGGAIGAIPGGHNGGHTITPSNPSQ